MSVSVNADLIAQVSAAHAQTPAPPAPVTAGEAPAETKKKSKLPVYFYNSRFPNEVFINPEDKWFNKAINAEEPSPDARTFSFFRGQFIAKEQWQVDLLRKIPYIHEANLEPKDEMRCAECNYLTRSTVDFVEHQAKHR